MTTSAPTVFLLHALGASGRSFDAVTAAWDGRFDVVAPDLPGFGGRAGDAETGLEAAVDVVVAAIRTRGAPRWLLVGHSMGGKVASLVAARALAGTAPVFGLAGVVLLAGSPPTPEPMSEDRRADMVRWVRDGPIDVAAADEFIAANTGAALSSATVASITEDLRRTAPRAWAGWLREGSRRDVSVEVGTLDVPALVLAGEADDDLGAAAQPRLHGEVYPRADFVTLPGAGHLLPAERPTEVAAAIVRFWDERAGRGPAVPADTARLIASDRVTAPVRGVLARRAVADEIPYAPRVLSPAQLHTLRAVAARVVPQGDDAIDLAARVDARLAARVDDGWRPADLPDDATAYRQALDALEGVADLDPDAQDAVLTALAAGEHDPAGAALSPQQLQHWFEDARHDLVAIWVVHPATAARIGFDGHADGGDHTGRTGFVALGRDERDAWEPGTVVTIGGNR